MGTKRTVYDVTPERFTRVWQLSSSVKEVARKLGMPKSIVSARASTYRQMGVKLKSFKVVQALDVQGLNALIVSLDKEPPTAGKARAPEKVMSRVLNSLPS